MKIDARQAIAGGIFIAIGLFFLVTGFFTLPIGNSFRMGPGYFPVVLSGLLVALGLAVALTRDPDAPTMQTPIPWRGLFFITLSPVLFALTVRGLGFAPALTLTIIAAAFASHAMNVQQAFMITAGLLVAGIVIFSFWLGLPFALIGPWLSG